VTGVQTCALPICCHTDITIPYDELGAIWVETRDGERISIIENGKFVLKGTEALNEAFTS